MINYQKLRKELKQLKEKLRHGDPLSLGNLAATYRMLGNRRRSFYWWKKYAEIGDGGAYLEIGYCYHYGIGVQRNHTHAINAYRRAIASDNITEYDFEEAQYHLAIALLDENDSPSVRRKAIKLLLDASSDGDYLQATNLAEQLTVGGNLKICRCRRGLQRIFGGKAQCSLHKKRRK